MSKPDQVIGEMVRAQDRDRYLSVLYAPAAKRQALFALYAFNAEIASIRDRIHDPLPGEIRLQWWRDVLEAGTVDAAAGHPLATALIETIRDHDLPIQAFVDMLDARVFDLYDDPMPTRSDLEGYCGETASALIQLAALVLDPQSAQAVANFAGHAGCAQAIAGLLRLVPIHRARGQCYIPADILAASGTTPQSFVAGQDEAAAYRVLQAMLALGREHWAACGRNSRLPGELRAAFQPASLAPMYFDAVARSGAKALTTPVQVSEWRRQWRAFMLNIRPPMGGTLPRA